MTVSIIIAVKTWQKNLEECVSKCRELDYPDFEIIVLPDDSLEQGQSLPDPVIIIPTGRVSPAKKRDLALVHASGEILAFIDDDAYPAREWLKNALDNFADAEVAAVGGPAITPESDSLLQKASGNVYASILVSAGFSYRYLPKQRRQVEDYPSCNFLVRKAVMLELGGFNTGFWPGEDTKLCLEITKKLKLKIIYDPRAIVFHHRRPLFLPHLKQVASYALHRGYFAKLYPQTSLKAAYFIPTIFVLTVLAAGASSIFFSPLRGIYICALAAYLSIVFIGSLSKNRGLILPVFAGIIFTHLSYGIYFLKGLLSPRSKEE